MPRHETDTASRVDKGEVKALTKKQAASLLNKSARTLNQYLASGRLKASVVNGRHGQELRFDEEEVRRLKEALETPAERAVIVTSQHSAVAPSASPSPAGSPELFSLLERIWETQSRMFLRDGELKAVDLSHKHVLTLAEAQTLTGISKRVIRDAIRGGELKGKLGEWGTGWRVKRVDVDVWVGGL